MKTFIGLITLSATASSVVGVVTQDMFNSLAMYTPLALISIVVKDTMENRKNKKILMEEK
ncbi:hypothetical protein ACLBV9_10420 [Staphylococcus succinus]